MALFAENDSGRQVCCYNIRVSCIDKCFFFSFINGGLNNGAPCAEIIDDIEDLISAQDITPKERYSSRKNVKVKAKKRVKLVICCLPFFISYCLGKTC